MKTKSPTRVTDAMFRGLLFSQLNVGNQNAHGKTAFWRHLQTKNKCIDRQRALRLHDIYYAEWCALTERTVNKEVVAIASTETRAVLATRENMIHFLQAQIDAISAQLNGSVKFTYYLGNKVLHSHNGDQFVLPVQAQNELRRVLQEYANDLSKICGHYAPTKIAQTDINGNDSINLTSLSDGDKTILFAMAAKIFNPFS